METIKEEKKAEGMKKIICKFLVDVILSILLRGMFMGICYFLMKLGIDLDRPLFAFIFIFITVAKTGED